MGNYPSSVRDVAGVIGIRKLVELSDHLRHRETYVPAHRMRGDHVLVRVLGEHDAHVLQREFGGCKLYVPRFRAVRAKKRGALIVAAFTAGESIEAIAARLGCCERTVARALRKAGYATDPGRGPTHPPAKVLPAGHPCG